MNRRRPFQASWITEVVIAGGTVLASLATATTGLLSLDIDFTRDLIGSIGSTNNGAAPQIVQGMTASSFPGLAGSGDASVNNSNAGTFAPDWRGGSFSVPVFTLKNFLLEGGGGQIASTQSTQSAAAAMVTYTFRSNDDTEIPETQTYFLLGGGLTMLALLRRRGNTS